MDLGKLWEILKQIVPLIVALINALKSTEDVPAASAEIKRTCEGIACRSDLRNI